MKTTRPYVCIIMFIAAGLCCKQIKEKLLPSFTVNIPVIRLTVPLLPFVADKEIAAGALRTHINLDSTIKAHTAGAFGANSVHLVKVKKIIIKMSNADKSNNLSNFESARMRIFNDTASSEIATIHFPQFYSDSISITTNNAADISSYLRGTNLAYNLYWKNRRKTSKSLKLEVQVMVSVQ